MLRRTNPEKFRRQEEKEKKAAIQKRRSKFVKM